MCFLVPLNLLRDVLIASINFGENKILMETARFYVEQLRKLFQKY